MKFFEANKNNKVSQSSFSLTAAVAAFFTFFFTFFLTLNTYAEIRTYEDYKHASEVLSKWFNRSFGHYDFLSATPMSLGHKGEKFFIIGDGNVKTQASSDYGLSMMQSHLNNQIKNAYSIFDYDPVQLPEAMEARRFHYSFGLGPSYDFSLSYVTVPNSDIHGYGFGLQKLHLMLPLFFYSAWSIKLSHVSARHFFSLQQIVLDYSVSMDLFLVDFYAGARYGFGHSKFYSKIPSLSFDDYWYVSNFNEIAFYYGAAASLTTNLRLNAEVNKINDETIYAFKISLFFDSILPKFENPFRSVGNLQ